MTTPRWVIDTNVLVSAAITPRGICDQLLQNAVSGRFVPIWDNSLLLEYRDVLSRPKFGLSAGSIRKLLAAFPPIGFCRGLELRCKLLDPADLPFVAVALAALDKTIVTGNSKHFPHATMRKLGITILSPREALVLSG